MTRLTAVIIGILTLVFLVSFTWGKEIDPNQVDWDKAENLALSRPVNVPEEGVDQMKINAGWGPQEKATDGDRNSANWMGWNVDGQDREEIGWCEVDLGEVVWIDTIRIWHYYDDQRTYHNVKLAVSTTGKFAGEEVVLFDGDDKGAGKAKSWIADAADDKGAEFDVFDGGEYQETPGGRLDHFIPVKARYVRDWVFGNTSNPAVHWVEIEAYSFLGALSLSDLGQLPILWGRIKSE